MKPAASPLAPVVLTLVLVVLLAACATPIDVTLPGAAPVTRGQAPGFASLKVCRDLNGNARCDETEPHTLTDAKGGFDLPGSEALVGEAGALVLRAPVHVDVLSPVSTELSALMDSNGGSLAAARGVLAERLGVAEDKLFDAGDARVQAQNKLLVPRIAAAVAEAGATGDRVRALRNRLALDEIETVVVIYAESRGFDTLFGLFPGADGIPGKNPASKGQPGPQKDFNGSVLPVLPPTWGGITAGGQPVLLTQAQSAGLPNAMFQIDDPKGIGNSGVVLPSTVTTRDLVHRFYNHIMQINGGSNDRFAAYSDAGGLTMGYYDGSSLAMWKLAQRYALADNFFMGAFGGSFLNHQYLVCACAPPYPNADTSPAQGLISAIDVDAQGRFVRLTPAVNMPASALAGAPRHQRDGALTPKDASGMFYAVNTMQPAFQPSGAPPTPGGDPRVADANRPSTLPAQTQATIGDGLNAKGVAWAWYAGGWNTVSAGTPEGRAQIYRGKVNFQPHHQPFNYYAAFDPAIQAEARLRHLRDFDSQFLTDAAEGKLPAVSFYKPQSSLSQHPGYANVADGDAHIADLIARLEQSPQWKRMLIVVTYDGNGGFYDHAPVPQGDRFGPGSRVPAIIVSPFAKRGHVDKTPYDTGSILRFITHRWSLPPLAGLAERDEALQRNGFPAMGDLSGALDFSTSVKQ
jgi:acid phosphatase